MKFITLCTLLLLLSCSPQPHDLSQYQLYPGLDLSKSDELHVLSYNLYMRTPRLFFWNKQKERTRLLPHFLRGYDVLVLQEVFGAGIRKQLLDSLASEYPYESKILGEDELLKQDGGVLVVSKWPIEIEKQVLYGETCAGADCLAKKGAIYTKIKKGERSYHIFSTHVQASSEHDETRAAQFTMMQKLIEDQSIPAEEAVIIAGDLNVNLFKDKENGEYSRMIDIFQATHPGPKAGIVYPPSLDEEANSLISGTKKSYLDYVLYANAYLTPDSSYNEVRIFRVGELDLSDHYAVYGYFSFSVE